jgi:hypothetical protein
MRPVWSPDWRLEAWGADWSVRLQFTPSYVHAGSATAVVTDRADGAAPRHLGPWPHNGYEGEWIELADLVHDTKEPRYSLANVLADLEFITDIADAAEALVLKEAAS